MSHASISKIPELPPLPPSGSPADRARGATGGAAPVHNILIARMREQADLSKVGELPRGPERKVAAYEHLVQTATETQAEAIAQLGKLKEQGLVSSFESMYLPNAILVTTAEGKHDAVTQALKGAANVQEVTPNQKWQVEPRSLVAAQPAAVEWGVAKLGAPDAWAKGITGAGVTVGVIDTGLDASHPAIAPHYRGTQKDGSQVHDYNWLDPFGGSATPFDNEGHGTHVAGSIAGGTADAAIGVAPGAKIIAAKGIMDDGYNTTAATLRALQFMLAPTDVKGLNPDPRRGADVVNNSWGNDKRDDTTFLDTWKGLLAAGIEPVTAAGNAGPGAGTVSPPGSYPLGLSVAASDRNDKVAGFSSRGPSHFAPEAVIPHVSAPGVAVVSAVPGGDYRAASGTSMAAPHAAGAVALMLQENPQASHEQIVRALASTATDIDKPGTDTSSGYGRINAAAAVDAVVASRQVRPAA